MISKSNFLRVILAILIILLATARTAYGENAITPGCEDDVAACVEECRIVIGGCEDIIDHLDLRIEEKDQHVIQLQQRITDLEAEEDAMDWWEYALIGLIGGTVLTMALD